MQPGPGGLCSGQPGPGGLWSVLWEAWSRSVVVCAPGSPVQEGHALCSPVKKCSTCSGLKSVAALSRRKCKAVIIRKVK